MFYDPEISSFRAFLDKNVGKTIEFDTYLDFSIWNEASHQIAIDASAANGPLPPEAANISGARMPLANARADGTVGYLDALVIEMIDPRRLKYDAGGTGIHRILFRGKFEIERRAYSGPSVECTLREERR